MSASSRRLTRYVVVALERIDIQSHFATDSELGHARGSGACLDIEQDERRWRVEVSAQGELKAIETTWRDGQLADLDQPDWLDDALARTRAVA